MNNNVKVRLLCGVLGAAIMWFVSGFFIKSKPAASAIAPKPTATAVESVPAKAETSKQGKVTMTVSFDTGVDLKN